MAMVKPITKELSAFDATQNHTFYFISNGGNQVVKNKIIIKNNNVNKTIVYQNTIESYVLQQEVPSNTLTNGNQYLVSFITYDSKNNASSESDEVLFYCYAQPSLTLDTITDNIVGSATYKFNVTYSQEQNEPIESVIFKLYDTNNIEIGNSGNLYGNNDKTTFSYTFSGFENNKNYSIIVYGITKYGTEINSVFSEFLVKYINPTMYTKLKLTNDCVNGKVNIETDLNPIDGETNLSPLVYIDNEKVDLRDYGYYVKWKDGFSVPSNFFMKIWFKVGLVNYEICRMVNSSNNKYMSLVLKREIPNGESVAKDCVLLKYDNKIIARSNYVNMMNSNTDCVLRFVKSGNNCFISLETSGTQSSSVVWEGSSNVEYNRLTNISYSDEIYPSSSDIIGENIEDLFPIDSVSVMNGMFDEVYISRNSNDVNKPIEWDINTILDCKFNNSINGGNIDEEIKNIKYLKVKKRRYGTTKWINVISKKIDKLSDVIINVNDYILPNNTKMQYAIVPILEGNIEGNYIINDIDTSFRATYISDVDQTFILYNAVYSENSRQKLQGIVQPIGRKYPILIENSKVDYEQGGISGTLYGYNFEKTKRVNRNDVVRQYNDFQDFLNNDKPKIIKDWNGNIWLVRIISGVVGSYNTSYGNGVIQISFSWVEQGKWDNEDDLIDNGFLE